MFEHLPSIVSQLADIQSVLLIVLGVAFGIVAGALPGLTPPIAIALMLPVTFGLDPLPALVLLASVYMAAEYGGSISAILINTPGTGGAVCTALDGFPLARQGRGLEALHASIIASTVGGVFGVIALLFFTPPLADFSLRFGPPEMFWLAIAGLSLVCNLSSDNFTKGVIMAVFGLWISMIGPDGTTGLPRFTFGIPDLEGGVPLIPALMGFFAISQMLNLIGSRQETLSDVPLRQGAFMSMLRYLFVRPFLLARSSIIGIVVGILPGAGAAIASFVSYTEARRYSKEPEKFGEGSFEGVASAEAANNAMVGGSLVPLLAFGIPGSASAAILFGALKMHGLLPGPSLFTDRGDVAYGFIIGLLPATLVMFVLGVVGARYFALVPRVRTVYIVPTVLSLTLIGSYTVRNNMADVVIAAGCGVLGFFLIRLGFRLAPVVLGIILGPIAEDAFNQSMSIARTRDSILLYWVERPISAILIAITLFILITAIWRERTDRRARRAAQRPLPETD